MILSRKEFMKYLDTQSEIEELEERLEILESRAYRTTQVFSDMPKGGTKKDTVLDLISVRSELEEKINQLDIELKKINDCINIVPNPRMRKILTLRYINNSTFRQIGIALNTSEESIKTSLYKFFKNKK